jgi:MoaA/NifB/PqqE/SkfB family radical SAM enzyme
MKPAIDLSLITTGYCNLGCKSCPGGRKEPVPSDRPMTAEMLERILDKCIKEARILVVRLYYYDEPFLIRDMPKMVALCHKYNLPVTISSNLNVFDKYGPAILQEALETLMISVSGFTQPVYERSHKGGDIERVKANMAKVAQLRSPKTHVQVSWHHYRYNEHEMPLMRDYARKLGFAFVSYATSLLPLERAMRVWETGMDDPLGEDLLIPVGAAREACYARRHWECDGQNRVLTVNGDGLITNCNNRINRGNLRGSLFDTTVPALLKARKTDADCIGCKAIGGHIYAMQAYTRPEWSPMRLAGVFCRRLGIEGYVESLASGIYGRALLPLAERCTPKKAGR